MIDEAVPSRLIKPPATEKPAILLLPGALGRVELLRLALERLGEKRPTLAVEYGTTIRPDGLVEAIDATLRRAGCERAHLVGLSLGATLARFAATLLERRFESLVLVGAGAPDAERGERIARGHRLLRWLPTWFLRYRFGREVGFWGGVVDAMSREELLAVRARQATLDLAAPALRPIPAELPVLRLDLENDAVIPPAERIQLTQRIKHARIETMRGLDHGATLSPPPSLIERIDRWCSEREGSAPSARAGAEPGPDVAPIG